MNNLKIYATLDNVLFDKVGKVYYGVEPPANKTIVCKITPMKKISRINKKDFFILLDLKIISVSSTEYNNKREEVRHIRLSGYNIICSLIAGEKYFHDIPSDLINSHFIKVINLSKLKLAISALIEETKKSNITIKSIERILNHAINLQFKKWDEKLNQKIENLTGNFNQKDEQALQQLKEREDYFRKFLKKRKGLKLDNS